MRGGADEGETSKKPVANFHHPSKLQHFPPPQFPPFVRKSSYPSLSALTHTPPLFPLCA